MVSLLALPFSGCLPYTVGSTARPVSPGERLRTTTLYVIPNAVKLRGDSVALPLRGIDGEVRFGLDDRSDIGVRVPTMSGIVVTYKRRLDAPSAAERPALAMMVGGGFVNFGEHLHLEGSLIASGREHSTVTPYGGLRAMQVIPVSRGAVSDSPTLGGFLGVRLGGRTAGVSPEIGAYYDRSALGLRRGTFLLVPAVSVHGASLSRLFHAGERTF